MMVLLTLFLGFAALGANHACVVPRGISDSEDGGLDLATMQNAPSVDLFNFANPVVATIGACSGGLETPISMRALLGGWCPFFYGWRTLLVCRVGQTKTTHVLASVVFSS